MAETYDTLSALFIDIADAIREKTVDTASIIADDFPSVIRRSLQGKIREDCLTFSSPSAFSIKTNNTSKNWDGTLEYSTNKKSWIEWNGEEISAASGADGYVLYFSGIGNTIIAGNNSNYKWVLTGSDISCIGNIETLLDYTTVEFGNHPTMAPSCYYGMFSGCTSLTQAPALPATTLADSCYHFMFYGCTNLIQAPALPATTLADSCYDSMFNGCTSLTQAPALPATTLIYSCYYNMFQDCTSLIQAPDLPATTLDNYCYEGMFENCTALTQAPALPATTLANYCYQNMFSGCTSLTKAPALPATTLANYCYYNMFSGCTSLTKAPALPAKELAKYCYYNMFENCTALIQAPSLPAKELFRSCYRSMFQGCTKLKLSSTKTGEYTVAYRIPKIGTGTTATGALSNMFANTGGTFTGSPSLNTTYYLSNTNIVVN